MALGTSHMSSTTLDKVLPEIWSSKMNEYFRANLVAASFFTDLSSDVAGGGDVLHIPSLSELTAAAKVNGAEVTLNSPTETSTDLAINVWTEASFMIEDKEAKQVLQSYNIQKRYIESAAYACAKKYDTDICALFVAGAGYSTGTSAAAVLDSDIRSAIRQLDAANVPQDGRAFFFTPKAIWTDLQSIDRFSLLVNTNGADPVLKGHIGYLYGIPVVVTTILTASLGSGGFALAHKDGIVHATAGGVRMQVNYIPERLGYLGTADVIYGVKLNRATPPIVWIKTAS